LQQAAARPAAHAVVDAEKPLAEVVSAVTQIVLDWLRARG